MIRRLIFDNLKANFKVFGCFECNGGSGFGGFHFGVGFVHIDVGIDSLMLDFSTFCMKLDLVLWFEIFIWNFVCI